jgi:hypothetical protein
MPPTSNLAYRQGYRYSEDSSNDLQSDKVRMYEGGRASERSRASENDDLWKDDPAESPGAAYRTPKDRIYFADWTRALAI